MCESTPPRAHELQVCYSFIGKTRLPRVPVGSGRPKRLPRIALAGFRIMLPIQVKIPGTRAYAQMHQPSIIRLNNYTPIR